MTVLSMPRRETSAVDVSGSADEPDAVKALFFVTGAADPGLLPRLLQLFAKLGLTPDRVYASKEHGRGEELTADLRIAGVAPHVAARLEGALRAVVGVRAVITVVE